MTCGDTEPVSVVVNVSVSQEIQESIADNEMPEIVSLVIAARRQPDTGGSVGDQSNGISYAARRIVLGNIKGKIKGYAGLHISVDFPKVIFGAARSTDV
jgi:hypothetical protein